MPRSGRWLRFEPEWRLTLFTAVMVPVLVSLGFWQLHRADEKAALAAAWDRRQAQPPALLQDIADQPAKSLAYLPVQLAGTFLQKEYFLLDNRMHGGRFGYEVIAILKTDDAATAVLVNRGWIAGDPARLALPAVPAAAGYASLRGHVYVSPGEPYLLAEQQLQAGWPKRIQAVEMGKLSPAVSALTGTDVFPYIVRIDADSPGALTVDWQVVNVSPQKHRGYALQWFTMAFVLGVFYLLRSSNLWQLLSPRKGKPDESN